MLCQAVLATGWHQRKGNFVVINVGCSKFQIYLAINCKRTSSRNIRGTIADDQIINLFTFLTSRSKSTVEITHWPNINTLILRRSKAITLFPVRNKSSVSWMGISQKNDQPTR